MLQEFDDTPEEIEAARIRNEEIDADIAVHAAHLARKCQSETSVLLAGQSGAGKSTLFKQFQLMCAPESMENERASWRGVIFLNVIKALRDIFEALNLENVSQTRVRSPARDDDSFTSHPSVSVPITSNLLNLRYRLAPLLSMETHLANRLKAGYHYDPDSGVSSLYVHQGWQAILPDPPIPMRSKLQHNLPKLDGRPSLEREEVFLDVSTMFFACKGDVRALWDIPDVQSIVRRRTLQLSEASSFFLQDLERISDANWSPTDDDILRARVRTVGLNQRTFEMPIFKNPKQRNWSLTDVGGSVGQRSAWVPFFEGSDAIIFLAPISAFDQFLEENRDMNCIEDSIRLFKFICGHPLLASTHIVLLLNKCDILEQKLKKVKLNKFIPSYGDRSNKADDVIQYFTDHFKDEFEMADEANGKGCRSLLVFKSSVVDSVTTRKLIMNIARQVNEAALDKAFIGVSHNKTPPI